MGASSKTSTKQRVGIGSSRLVSSFLQFARPRSVWSGPQVLLLAALLFTPILSGEVRAASVISLDSCSSVSSGFHKRGLRALVDSKARKIFVYDRTISGSTGWGALGRLFGVVSKRCSLVCAVGHANLRKSRLGPRGFHNILSRIGRARTKNFPVSNPTTSYRRLLNRGFRAWFVSCQQNAGGAAAPGPSAPQAPDPAPAAPDPAPAAPDPAPAAPDPAPAAPDPAPAAPDPAPAAPDNPGDQDNGENEPA